MYYDLEELKELFLEKFEKIKIEAGQTIAKLHHIEKNFACLYLAYITNMKLEEIKELHLTQIEYHICVGNIFCHQDGNFYCCLEGKIEPLTYDNFLKLWEKK